MSDRTEIPTYVLGGQERVREAGLCGELIADGTQMCIREAGHEPPHGDAAKFWQLPDIYVERLPADDGLRIWVQGQQVVLGAESADSLLQWMDRSRG